LTIILFVAVPIDLKNVIDVNDLQRIILAIEVVVIIRIMIIKTIFFCLRVIYSLFGEVKLMPLLID
jgi:hypothetical protein